MRNGKRPVLFDCCRRLPSFRQLRLRTMSARLTMLLSPLSRRRAARRSTRCQQRQHTRQPTSTSRCTTPPRSTTRWHQLQRRPCRRRSTRSQPSLCTRHVRTDSLILHHLFRLRMNSVGQAKKLYFG